MIMIEDILVTITEDSMTIQSTDEDGCTGKESSSSRSDIPEELREDWLIHSFYRCMSDITDFCGASFLTEKEETDFHQLLKKETKLPVRVKMMRPVRHFGPFPCSLEVYLSRQQDLQSEVMFRFYWDELKD